MKKGPILQHLGIIMDGNRRWAKQHGLKSFFGHKYGKNKVNEVVEWSVKSGIKYLTIWTFSAENWARPKNEVNYLISLVKEALEKDVKDLHKQGIKIKFLGSKENLPKDLQESFLHAEQLTKNNSRMTLNIAFNYGGQQEIIDAVNKILNKGLKKVSLESFEKYLYNPEMPKPELIIRPSGEMRTSGFLLWESAYSELYFCKSLWPDFSERDFNSALADYQQRQRRFGK